MTLDYQSIDLSYIEYSKPEKEPDTKRYITKVNYDSEPFLIQTTKLKVKKIYPGEGIALEITDPRFYEFLVKIDELNKKKCFEHSETWFKGKKIPYHVIESGYKSSIIPGQQRSYIYINLDSEFEVYKDKKLVDPSKLKKDQNVICILEYQGLQIGSKVISNIWNLVQLKISTRKYTGYLFNDSDSEDEVLPLSDMVSVVPDRPIRPKKQEPVPEQSVHKSEPDSEPESELEQTTEKLTVQKEYSEPIAEQVPESITEAERVPEPIAGIEQVKEKVAIAETEKVQESERLPERLLEPIQKKVTEPIAETETEELPEPVKEEKSISDSDSDTELITKGMKRAIQHSLVDSPKREPVQLKSNIPQKQQITVEKVE